MSDGDAAPAFSRMSAFHNQRRISDQTREAANDLPVQQTQDTTTVGKIVLSGPSHTELENWYRKLNSLAEETELPELIELRDEVYSHLKG